MPAKVRPSMAPSASRQSAVGGLTDGRGPRPSMAGVVASRVPAFPGAGVVARWPRATPKIARPSRAPRCDVGTSSILVPRWPVAPPAVDLTTPLPVHRFKPRSSRRDASRGSRPQLKRPAAALDPEPLRAIEDRWGAVFLSRTQSAATAAWTFRAWAGPAPAEAGGSQCRRSAGVRRSSSLGGSAFASALAREDPGRFEFLWEAFGHAARRQVGARPPFPGAARYELV